MNAAAWAGLNAAYRRVLAAALTDAVEYRQPTGICADCDTHPAGLCEPHAADLDRAEDYAALARQLGLEADE